MRHHIRYRTIARDQGSAIGKKNQQAPEQLIIRVGKGCNFRCIFCNVAENESVLSLKSSIKEILAITFYKIKYSKFLGDHINIAISGGEPSIFQKETIFILKYFGSYFHKRGIKVSFDLQSNASNVDAIFASTIAGLGVTQALVSSHAHDPEIFRSIIGVDYSLMGPKFERGVQSLLDAGVDVTFNIILNKINKNHYFDHIQYLVHKYPKVELYNIGFVQPHGMAQENFERLFVQYEEVASIYSRVIAYLKSHNKRVHSHFVGLPLCHLDDWSNSMEYMYNKGLFQGDPSQHTLIHNINDTNKMHPASCDECSAKRVCSGVWKEYANIQRLKPLIYPIVSSVTIFSSYNRISLKKEYDSGKRVFSFRFTDELSPEISSAIDFLKSLGYVWISLIVEGLSIPDSLSQFAGTNIQLIPRDVEHIKSAVERISVYNNSVPFQFRVQLDVLIYDPSVWDMDSILKQSFGGDIFLRLPRNYKYKDNIKGRFVRYSL